MVDQGFILGGGGVLVGDQGFILRGGGGLVGDHFRGGRGLGTSPPLFYCNNFATDVSKDHYNPFSLSKGLKKS